MTTLKVSAKTNPNSLAGTIREAGSLNQTVKAVAIVRSFVALGGIDFTSFCDVEIDGEERIAM